MDFYKFETLVKKLDKNKYHISRTVKFNENGPFISEWDIFRKNMSTEEYFSSKNLAVLSSRNGNTIEDIEKLVNEERCRGIKFWTDIIKRHKNGKLN